MLDLRIETFLMVCETMNYTKAARRLNITQPAVSQHIRYLEEYYGKKLFCYSGKKLTLTRAGEMLRQVSGAMRNDEDLLRRRIKEEDPEVFPLYFGVTKTIGEYVIAKPLARYMRRHPDTPVQMEISNTDVLLRHMREGIIHFALVEGYFNSREYDSIPYAMVPFVPVCAAGHRFSAEPYQTRDLLGENLILREQGSGTRMILERQLNAMNLQIGDFRRVCEIGGMHAILQMLQEDAGISFMYLSAAQSLIDQGVLRQIPLRDFHTPHTFNFIWERGSVHEPIYREICAELGMKERTDRGPAAGSGQSG